MSAEGEVRKPWRARKTMPASSRSQMKALKKAKGGGALVAVAPKGPLHPGGPEATPFLDARSLQDLLCYWYKDEAWHPLCPSLEVRPDVPSPAEEAPTFERVTDIREAALGRTVQDGESSHQKPSSAVIGRPLSHACVGEGERARLEGGSHQQSNPLKEGGKVPARRGTPSGPAGGGGAAAEAAALPPREEGSREQLYSQDIHRRKKRPRLEEGKEAFPKPSRPSDTGAGAEKSDKKEPEVTKVKGFIQEQLGISMEALDHRLQDLHRRIERTQCLRKHEGISIKIVKRISRLDKHLNRAITVLSSKINRPGSHSQNKPPNGGTKSKRMPSKEPPSNPREMSHRAAEQSDDVVCVEDNVSQNPTVQAVNPTDVGQKETSANVDVSAAAPCSSKNLFVIDLTEEENKLHKDKEAKRRGNSTEESRTLNPPQPLLEASNQGPGDLSRLPPLPKPRLHPGPAESFQGTLPPQKLALAVACLERPKGIALRWGVLDPDPRCAPVESFHLFFCQEEGAGSGRKGILSAWRETHHIPAVSLSMACSLADFPPSTWCYFAMRARDVYGREGPFSEVRSVFTA